MKNKLWFIFLLAHLLQISCKEIPSTKEEINRYIKNEANGFSITKKTGIFNLNVTFIPQKLKVMQENQNNIHQQDSAMQVMDKSLLFIFTIAPLEGKTEGDVFMSGVNSKQDYEERVRKANFGFANSWTLYLDNGVEISPVGVQMEQTNGLTNDRKFHILFDISQNMEANESKIWDLKLNDEVFNCGIHHFVFMEQDRNRLK